MATTTVVPSPNGAVLVSRAVNRSAAGPLAGSTVTPGESVYVFLDSPLTALSVRFSLDGALMRTEATAPWDFNGGATPTANPYVANLAVGAHTITAVMTRPDGSTITFTSPFTVGTPATTTAAPTTTTATTVTIAASCC